MARAAARVWPRMTADDFMQWDGGGHQGKLELVDGEVRAMAPASAVHSKIQTNLAIFIGNHLRSSRPSCGVLVEAPVQPRLDANHNVLAPDLGVTCAPVGDAKILEDPILLIEVLSPGNSHMTRENVWAYTTIPSVQEIVLVHSTRARAEMIRKDAKGAWPKEAEILNGDGDLRLVSIACAIPMAEIYDGTHLAPDAGAVRV